MPEEARERLHFRLGKPDSLREDERMVLQRRHKEYVDIDGVGRILLDTWKDETPSAPAGLPAFYCVNDPDTDSSLTPPSP